MRSRWPRLRWLLLLLAVPIVFVAGLIGVLVITNPEPAAQPGWSRHATMPEPRGEVASAVAGGRLYVAGGLEGRGGTSQAVSVFSATGPDGGRWTDGPRLPEPRHHAAAAALERDVYVGGGAASATDWTPRPEVWRLPRGDDTWEAIAPMPEGRLGHDIVEVGGRLYVIGGTGGADVLIFEPEVGWRRGATLPEARDHIRAVAVDEAIWAIGGRSNGVRDRVDVYAVADDEWQPGPPLPMGMSAMAVGVVAGRIHVVGGEDPDTVGGGVIEEHYSIAADALLVGDPEDWRREPSPMLAVHGAGYGAIGDRLFVAAGSSRQGALSPLAWTGVTQSFNRSGRGRS